MCPQAGCFPWSRPMPHTHQNVGQGGKLSEYSDVFNLADIIADVLTDHNKAAHDALAINADQVDGEEAAAIVTEARVGAVLTKAIVDALAVNAGQVDGVEGAEIVQRDGSIPLTAHWDVGAFNLRAAYHTADGGGVISLGNLPNTLRLEYDANETAEILGVSNATAGLKISNAIISGKAQLTAPTELTINAGVITVTKSYHIVDTEGDAAADDLDTINGGVDGAILVLQTADGARDVTIKHNTGNIYSGVGDFVLTAIASKIVLFYDGISTKWIKIGTYPSE